MAASLGRVSRLAGRLVRHDTRTMTTEPLWLFADQLGPHVHSTDEHRDREVVLVESTRVLHRKRFHRQKLHLVLSGMRHLAAELGDRATYLRTDTYREALERVGRPVVVHEPTSHAALAFVERLQKEGLVAEILPTPTFALPRAEFTEWAGDRTAFRMEDFYRSQRRRFDVLMEGGEPVGGKWNLDHENREPPPRGAKTLGIVAPWQPPEDEIDEQVRADLDALDLPTVGRDGPRWFAVTADEARRALAHFVSHRLPHFGPHEDAMLQDDWPMAHSLLSVPLNLGLLHPLDVAREAESAFHTGDVPLASAEGFVRQVLGWREYMWHLYWHFGPDYLGRNELRAHTPLPDWWVGLDADTVTAACLRSRVGRRPRPRLDPPHPAADAARQPRPATRLPAAGAVGLVPRVVRRRVRVGDADQRDRHEPARRRRPARDEAVRVRRGLHQPDVRPLRPLRVRPPQAARGRRVPVHRRLLGLGAPPPRDARREQPDGAGRGVDAAAHGPGRGAGAGVGAGEEACSRRAVVVPGASRGGLERERDRAA